MSNRDTRSTTPGIDPALTESNHRKPVAIVTGAAGGIGSGIVRTLAAANWQLLMVDVELPTDHSLPDEESAHSWHRVDVGDPEQVELLFDDVVQQQGCCPDLLVNNAATQIWSPLLELDPQDWNSVIRTNLTGSFLMTQCYAKSCVALNRPGNIINIGSGCNHLAFPNLSSYVASKGGIEMLTRSAALELGKYQIRVNCIAPGAIETHRTKAETDEYAESWGALTPLGRVGIPEDVANAILLLSDPKSEYITGQTLGVDGGLFSQAIWPQNY